VAISIDLDTVALSVTNPESPSLPLTVLNTVGIALNILPIPTPGPAVQMLDTVGLVLTLNSFAAETLSTCEAKTIIKQLRLGGWARTTPAPFMYSDTMNIVNAIRANTSLPIISHSDSCLMSQLLNAISGGSPPPFEPPPIGDWFGEGEPVESPPIPVASNLIILIGNSDWKIVHSVDSANSFYWAYPSVVIPLQSPAGYVSYIEFIGNHTMLLSRYYWSTPYKLVYRTINYGINWQVVNLSSVYSHDGYPECISNLGDGNVFLGISGTTGISNGCKMLRSSNYGLTWDSFTTPHSNTYRAIKLSNGNIIYSGGGGPSGSSIHTSLDGGLTWPYMYNGPTHSGVTNPSSYFLDMGDGIVLFLNSAYYSSEDSYNKVLKSTDWGLSWNYVGTVSGLLRTPVAAINLGGGVALIANASSACRIHKTTDYGETWTSVFSTFDSHTFRRFVNFGGGNIVALANDSYNRIIVYRSTDNGNTWSSVWFSSLTSGPAVYIP